MTDDEWSKIVELIKSDQVILAMQIGVGFGMSKVEVIRKYWCHTSTHQYKLMILNHRLWDYSSHGSVTLYGGDSSIVSQYYDNFTHDEVIDKFIGKLIKLIENESKD